MQPFSFVMPIPVDGVRRDLPENALPPTSLVDSQNMLLRRGRFQSRYGYGTFATNTTGQQVLGIAAYRHADASDKLVVGTTVGWWRYNSGTNAWVDISGTALSSATNVIFRVFQKSSATHLLGINNGVSVMKKWDGAAATYSDVAGTPPKAKAMMVLANRVLLFNLAANGGYAGVISPVGYDVSAFNDFDSGWGTVLNGLLIDTPGDIVGALEMGDLQGAIYKQDAVIMAIAQGSTVPFRFEWRVIGNIGPMNARCIVAVKDGSHVYLARDGSVMRFDGVSCTPLGFHLQRVFVDDADLTTTGLAQAYGYYDNEREEIKFYYKRRTTSAMRSVVILPENWSAWPMDYQSPLDTNSTEARVLIPGTTATQVLAFKTSNGQAYQEGADYSDGGTLIPLYWQYGVTDGGDGSRWKTINQIDHLFRLGSDDPKFGNYVAATNVTVKPYYSDSGDPPAATTDSDIVSLTAGASNVYVTNHRATSRLLGLRYESTGSAAAVEYRGATVTGVVRGSR